MVAPMVVHPADIFIQSDGSVTYQGDTSKSMPVLTDHSQAIAAGGNSGCVNADCTGNGNTLCKNLGECNTTGPGQQ